MQAGQEDDVSMRPEGNPTERLEGIGEGLRSPCVEAQEKEGLGASCGRQSSKDGQVRRLSFRFEFERPGKVKVSFEATSSNAVAGP